MLYKLVKPVVFLLPAEFSHKLILNILYYLDKLFILDLYYKVSVNKNLSPEPKSFISSGLVGLAAGLDKNADYISALSKLGFDYIEVGTVTPRPQTGNDKPRLFRLIKHNAIVNRMGFNNKGIDYLISRVKKFNKDKVNSTHVKLGINIGKNRDTPLDKAIDDYLICLEKSYNYCDYIVINISSPNTKNLRDLQDEKCLDGFLNILKSKQLELSKQYDKYIPMALKIAPDLNNTQLKNICSLIIKNNIDIIIATNTTIADNYPDLLNTDKMSGGLSGRPVYNISNNILSNANKYFIDNNYRDKITIIGVGGIDSVESACEKIRLGADKVQIYTGLIYMGPGLIKKLKKGLHDYYTKKVHRARDEHSDLSSN